MKSFINKAKKNKKQDLSNDESAISSSEFKYEEWDIILKDKSFETQKEWKERWNWIQKQLPIPLSFKLTLHINGTSSSVEQTFSGMLIFLDRDFHKMQIMCDKDVHYGQEIVKIEKPLIHSSISEWLKWIKIHKPRPYIKSISRMTDFWNQIYADVFINDEKTIKKIVTLNRVIKKQWYDMFEQQNIKSDQKKSKSNNSEGDSNPSFESFEPLAKKPFISQPDSQNSFIKDLIPTTTSKDFNPQNYQTKCQSLQNQNLDLDSNFIQEKYKIISWLVQLNQPNSIFEQISCLISEPRIIQVEIPTIIAPNHQLLNEIIINSESKDQKNETIVSSNFIID